MHDSNHTSYINFIGFEKEKKKQHASIKPEEILN